MMNEIQDKKYLTEAVDISEIKAGALNVIQAPCGSGKSYFALNKLPETVSKNSKLLYVIDTINGREQKLKEKNTTPYGTGWEELIKRGSQEWDGIGEAPFDHYDEDKIVVITYAKFGVLANRYPDFGYQFEVIVCDELHSGVEMVNFKKDQNGINYVKIAINRLKEIVICSQPTKVIALTATPTRVINAFKGYINNIHVDEDVHRYVTKKTIVYNSLPVTLREVKSKRGIIYTAHIRDMKNTQEQAEEMGIKAIAVWSIHNTEHPMTDEQLRVRDYILEKEELPPEYEAVIINKSNETAINIRGRVDYIIVHSQEADVREQARGRYRGNLDVLYIYNRNAGVTVPEEFLNCPLSKEDRDMLCAILKLRNASGNQVKWKSTRYLLEELGYEITVLARKDNKRYYEIKNKDNASKQ